MKMTLKDLEDEFAWESRGITYSTAKKLLLRAEAAESQFANLTAQMEKVTAEIECNWCRAHADGFDCRFCAAPRVASPNAEIKHDANCLTRLLASFLPEAGREIKP